MTRVTKKPVKKTKVAVVRPESTESRIIVPDFSRPMDLSCVDWETRIRRGQSLMPDGLILDRGRAKRARRIFEQLVLPDVPGTPTFGEVGGEWIAEFVEAVMGTWNGQQRGITEFFELVPKKNSKALALDTLVATPEGFTSMGDLKVGDLVMAVDGKPTKITAKSRVFKNHTCYRVTFSTGESVVCDGEHLWVTDTHADREEFGKDGGQSVRTTEEIARTVKFKRMRDLINNHRTYMPKPLDLKETKLPIPPYVLGIWLANGECNGARFSQGAHDVEHIVKQIKATGHSVRISSYDKRNSTVYVSLAEAAGNEKLPYRFRNAAMKLNLYHNKHIPRIYLRSSRDQRLALLRGLMDTDGSISKSGQASYQTTDQPLAEDVRELIASLGYKQSITSGIPKWNGKPCARCWGIQFWPFKGETSVFTLKRKSIRQKPRPDRVARSETRQIVSVRKVKSVPTQCIAVASKTKQYLVTRSLIPTHNTTNGAGIMVTALIENVRPRAEFLLIAPTQAVANLAFQQAVGMIEADDELKKRFHIKEYIKKVEFIPYGATLQIKSFDPSVVTGVKPAGVLIDELHVISDHSNADRVLGQLRGGLVSQPEGFLIFITTQSERPPSGIFRSELMKARKIRDGKLRGMKMLPILYEFPESISGTEEWKNPKVWHMVLPNNGRSVTVERLQEDYRTAVEGGDEELKRWASQHLNIEIGIGLKSDHWSGGDYWLKANCVMSIGALIEQSTALTVGIDGGGLDDMLALTVVGRLKKGGWCSWNHSWIHKDGVERRKVNGEIYAQFAKEGDLTIFDVMGDDLEELGELMKKVNGSGKLGEQSIGVDPAGIGAIIDCLAGIGIDTDKQVVSVPQGWRLTSSIQTVERKLADGSLTHSEQSLTRWAVENAKVEPRGNAVLITKQVSGRAKIDPLMSLFNAVELMGRNPQGEKSYQMMVIGA